LIRYNFCVSYIQLIFYNSDLRIVPFYWRILCKIRNKYMQQIDVVLYSGYWVRILAGLMLWFFFLSLAHISELET